MSTWDDVPYPIGTTRGSHRCTLSCYNENGVRTCGNAHSSVSAELENQVRDRQVAAEQKKNKEKASEVVSAECLSLMSRIRETNSALLTHRKNLKMNQDYAAKHRKEMEEYNTAAEGEQALINERLSQINDLKARLITELQASTTAPDVPAFLQDDIGRSV